LIEVFIDTNFDPKKNNFILMKCQSVFTYYSPPNYTDMKISKMFLILLLSLLTTGSAISQKSDSKPKIKSIVVLEEKNDVLIKKQLKESETYYDQKGNILEEIRYKQGKVNKHFKYQYDSNSNKIKEEEYNPSGDIIESSEYKYDNGMRIEKIVYDEKGKIISKKIYQYTTY
jgi:hypothetical protein